MIKAKLILLAVRFIMGLIAMGLGIWYLSSSIGGASLTYTSMNNFLVATGVENGDIASANGCFMCKYVTELFGVIGRASEFFWTAMVDHIWILLVVGFGIFLFVYTGDYFFNAAKKAGKFEAKEQPIEFKPWFDKVWKQAVRILFVGALMGALGMGGTAALKTVSQITITPVLYVGSALSMAASGVNEAAQCGALNISGNATDDILNPIMQPFMCVVGNINSVMLAGAAGGFSLMNYAWMGLGGGAFTWIAGLALVLMFLVIGFDLFFQIFSVIFKLIFIIIFLPLLLAAAAFDGTWKLASGLTDKTINTLVSSAVKIVSITLKVIILYATVAYAADAYFPSPVDGYSAVLPPMLGRKAENPDAQTLSVMNTFAKCEQVGLVDGEMDADKFKECFMKEKEIVENQYPGAFDFLDDGWDFLLLMMGLFVLYYYAVNPKIDKLLGQDKAEEIDYGGWIRDLGKQAWNLPVQLTEKLTKNMGKKD